MTPAEHNPQPELGAFERYARIIKLSDLDLPPLPIYDHYHLAGEASKEFADLSIRDNNAYALVIKDNNILGYLAWKELTVSQHDPTSQVKDFLFSFSQEQLLSPNTSIFDAYRLFQQHPSEVCFVTKDGQPNAILNTWLLYSSGGMQICLYAMLTSLERSLLGLMQFYGTDSLFHLKSPFLWDAIELYDRRRLLKNYDGTYKTNLLLGCTNISTKLHIARNLPVFTDEVYVTHKIINLVVSLRNFLAHPEQRSRILVPGSEETFNLNLNLISTLDEFLNSKLTAARDNTPPITISNFTIPRLVHTAIPDPHPALTPAEHDTQSQLGAFGDYARIIKLSDLDLPPLPIYEYCDLADEVYEDLGMNLFEEDNSCVLIRKDQQILGYVPFQELLESEINPTQQVSELMTKYTKEQFLSTETSMFDALTLFEQRPQMVCFFTKNDQPKLLNSWRLLNSGSMRICIYAMLTSLELSLLRLMQFYDAESLSHLQPPYRDRAIEIYGKHGGAESGGKYNQRDLLACTTLATKLHIARKLSYLNETKFGWDDNFINTVVSLRNFLAHPEQGSEMLMPGEEELFHYQIRWIANHDQLVKMTLDMSLCR